VLWSLTSRRTKRISGSKKFSSSAAKDFFNSIRHKQPFLDSNRGGATTDTDIR
jgi:hypothetical protein